MDTTYWQKQLPGKPLFSDVEWSKPEQRTHAGRLGIVGGSKLGFAGVAEAHTVALKTGAGDAIVLLPKSLKKTIPSSILDTRFAADTVSGGLSKDALPELKALGNNVSAILFIGDAGRNSETAVLYETFLQEYDGPVTISRDAFDLVKNNAQLLAERPNTSLILSFAQVQKLIQGVYYPKMLTFSMQLMQLVEVLHKFTLTYPVTLTTLHKDTLIIAHGGKVVTQTWENPMAIWRGSVATAAACWWLWNPSKPLESIATSITTGN